MKKAINLIAALVVLAGCANPEKDMGAYLFTYFNDATHSLFMAISHDGYEFTALNESQPVINGYDVAEQYGIRDPHIQRGPDGTFYIVMTDLNLQGQRMGYRDTQWERSNYYGWGNNRGLVFMKSDDLIHWTHNVVRIDKLFPEKFGEIGCAWAPESIWDPKEKKMMVYFTVRQRPEGEHVQESKTKLFYSYADKDFTTLVTEPQVLFEYPDPKIQVLDADICPMPDGRYFMTYVAQENPGGIKYMISDQINHFDAYNEEQIDGENGACEAPNTWKRIGEDKWVTMYDVFSIQPNNFGFVETTDFKTWTPIGRFNDGVMKANNFSTPKHGSIIQITDEEAERLEKYYEDLNKDFRTWAKTPPMGWNSWDCYGPTVVEDEVKANTDYMARYLRRSGWEYIVVDIRWYVANDKAGGYNQTDPIYSMDEYGRYQPAVNRFPSAADGKGFKELADYIHSRGLKFGIHLMRGIPKIAVEQKTKVKGTDGITADMIYNEDRLCRWLGDNYSVDASKPGAQEYYNSLFEQYAEWGLDFIKIDDLSAPYHQEEIELIRNAIDNCGRHIVLSTSPGKTPVENAEHVSTHANMWRMVNDVWDVWRDIPNLMRTAQGWYDHIAPGTWPDCDMIPLGHISIRGERGEDRMTRLTQDEQYTLMTFFTIFRSPLMFGGDLPTMDSFTLSLLTNREVLRMHREGSDVKQLFQQDNKLAVTSTNHVTGEKYLALFNIDDEKSQELSVALSDLGLANGVSLTEMWSGEKLGEVNDKVSVTLKPHACALYKLK